MTEISQEQRAPSGHSRSAVGRLTLIIEVDDGTEKVAYERRWPDARAARLWCEDKLRRAPEDAAVLEILVVEEVWGHRYAWEATASRHVPETLQLGLRTPAGTITWGAAHAVGS